jgi:hypothetical protein
VFILLSDSHIRVQASVSLRDSTNKFETDEVHNIVCVFKCSKLYVPQAFDPAQIYAMVLVTVHDLLLLLLPVVHCDTCIFCLDMNDIATATSCKYTPYFLPSYNTVLCSYIWPVIANNSLYKWR